MCTIVRSGIQQLPTSNGMVKPKTGIATKPVLDCHPSGTWPKARCAHLSIAENPKGPGMNPLK